MTFTVEEALMSPMGLAVLTGAGLIQHSNSNNAYVHCTIQTTVDENKQVEITLDDLREELGLLTATKFTICGEIPKYATEFTNDGASGFYTIGTSDDIEVTENSSALLSIVETDLVKKGTSVIADFYVTMANSITTVEIGPEDFGGYFYVEGQTLFRDEATGKDYAANVIFPKVKIQSGFTFTMAASGDPSRLICLAA